MSQLEFHVMDGDTWRWIVTDEGIGLTTAAGIVESYVEWVATRKV